MIAFVAPDDAMKRGPRQKIHHLCEQRLADLHEQSSESNLRKHRRLAVSYSSRNHPETRLYFIAINNLQPEYPP